MHISRGCTVPILVGAVLVFAGCQKRALSVAPPPPPPSPAATALKQAESSFVAGDYRQAAAAYESYLQLAPEGDRLDEALFRLGLMHVVPEGPFQDWRRASAFLERVVDEFPHSPFRAPASLILSLQNEVADLTADVHERERQIRDFLTSSVVPVLEEANSAFVAGDYRHAAEAYEEYLQSSPLGDKRDEALFRLGLIYALPEGPTEDWERASAVLKRLIDEFPQSPFRAPASLVLSLQSEVASLTASGQRREQQIRQLTSEIEKLTKIDAGRAAGSRNRGDIP